MKVDYSQYLDHLKQGGVLIYPTETFYGLGALASDEGAVQKIFAIKQRDRGKPLSVLISSLEMLLPYIKEPNQLATELMKKYWPGPLTILFDYKGGLAPSLNCMNNKIAARISSHLQAQLLMQNLQVPLTTTSANLSGEAPIFSVEDFPIENPSLKIMDAGELPPSLGSTIVDVTGNQLTVIRQGDLHVAL